LVAPSVLSVVSFNICGHPLMRPDFHTRAGEFARQIEQRRVDVVALQEVYTAAQVRFLHRRLPSLPFVAYRPGVLGQPRGGLVIFSRHPVQRPAFASFAGTAVWRLSRKMLRVAVQVPLKGLLLTRLRGPGLVVANVHPSPNHDGDWSPGNRFHPVHQAQLDRVNAVCRKYDVDLLCGDFNVASSSRLFQDFRAAGGWYDVFGADDPPTFHVTFLGPGHDHAKRIDYILLRPGDRVPAIDGAQVLFDGPVALPGHPAAYVSDHMALHAAVRLDDLSDATS
jgi:endonuclease/exonuclease/phosphatase family metal-dependent hydrolase